MASNHLPGGAYLPELSRSMFSEATLDGVGFGLSFAVTMDPARTLLAGSAGEYYWGGMASTAFWIDPAEELITIFMTQLVPSSSYPIRRELRTMVYAAIQTAISDAGGFHHAHWLHLSPHSCPPKPAFGRRRMRGEA